MSRKMTLINITYFLKHGFDWDLQNSLIGHYSISVHKATWKQSTTYRFLRLTSMICEFKTSYLRLIRMHPPRRGHKFIYKVNFMCWTNSDTRLNFMHYSNSDTRLNFLRCTNSDARLTCMRCRGHRSSAVLWLCQPVGCAA